ncbi:MAG TPA: non-canonical purine NTP pyrophosphatase [Gemmatimonadales bacterium]|nr:non-canonical purine NTP pyrophosphatase [Gemmatimonadales bacterium]
MKLLAATRSAGKQREIRRVLEPAGLEVVFPEDAGLWETEREATLETAETFEGNARRKAEYFARLSGLPTVADDSGLEVFALGGAPGVRSKRFAGTEGSPDAVDQANNAELLRRLRGASEPRRRARYRCVLVYLREPSGVPEVFEGAAVGRILEAPQGTGGFGYDPLFYSDELGKSFGEASPEEKDRVSHRGRALRALVAALAPAPASGPPPAAS